LAINKRKILQSAQKNLQKGAFDKALKDYKSLLEADPKDVNLRLKVGDVYLKQGKSDEAVAAYKKVAERFMKDGFDAKAVALYKQITKIDTKRVDVYVPLAELYQRLGLISDAMGALQTAADAHYREGDKPAALELLRKMATLDPTNTTNRLKVAELLRQEGMTPEALSEFAAVAEELERQDEIEGRVSVLLKILELEPGQGKALQGVARGYLAQRKWSQAEEIGQQLVNEIAEFAVEGYEILVESTEGLGREDEVPNLYQMMAQALRERGDDDRARELVQRYCGGGALDADDNDDRPQLASPEESAAFDAAVGGDGAFGDDELDDPGFVTDSGLRLGSVAVERDAIDGRRRASAGPEASNKDMPLPPLDGEEDEVGADSAGADGGVEETDTPVPEGDPEQLVAEASVYLRYGKSDRAVESLRAALLQEPAHLVALEKLGEALVASGDTENAVQAWLRGAETAAAAGDTAGVTALHGRVAELDPSAVPSAEAPAPVEPSPDASADAEVAAEDASGVISDEDDIEIEIDEDSFDEPEESVDEVAASAATEEAPEASDDDATEVELDNELELDDEWVADESADGASLDDSKTSEIEIELSEPQGDAAEDAAFTDRDAGDLELGGEEFLTDEPANDMPGAAPDEIDEPIFDEALSDELAAEAPAPARAEAAETEQPISDTTEATDPPVLDMTDESDQPVFDEADESDPPVLEMADDSDLPVLDEAFTDDLVTDEPAADEPSADASSTDDSDLASSGFDESLHDEFVTDEPVDDLAAGAESSAALDDTPESLEESAAPSAEDESIDLSDLEDSGADLDLGDLDEAPREPAADTPAPIVAAPEAGSSTTPEQIVEELEEGEFYLEQGMLDEAAEVYERILAVAPSHPQAMVRLGEIEARRTEEPSPEAAGQAAAEPPADDDDITGQLPASEAPDAAVHADADCAPDVDTDSISEPGDVDADSISEPGDVVEETVEVASVADPLESEVEESAEASDEGDFDLAAELSDVFDDDQPAVASRSGAGTEEEGFEQVFAAFKAGVDKELGESDHEARYDLGIAYKEMGLLDDAIGEFRVAMQDPERQLHSLHMMGVCALDLGRGEDAVAHFEQALAIPGIPENQQMALRFDLGCAEAERGDRERARSAWEAVIAIDPDFQDVTERLALLEQEPEEAPEQEDSEEAFESFDDLISETISDEPAEAKAAPVEEYESFDDLMSDDDSETVDDTDEETDAPVESADEELGTADESVDPREGADVTEVAEVTEVTAEETAEPALDAMPDEQDGGGIEGPASEPEPEPDPEPPTPKKRRRKKISFM